MISFQIFTALRISYTTVSNVRYIVKQITKRVNSDFRRVDSDTRYSLFAGFYGIRRSAKCSDNEFERDKTTNHTDKRKHKATFIFFFSLVFCLQNTWNDIVNIFYLINNLLI